MATTSTVSNAAATNAAAITNGTGSAAGTAGKANTSTIAGNFDQFLSLLTTQLKNQSPLEPLNANEFTQQLVQFAGVEQQLRTNDTLSSLAASTKSSALVGALGLVGARITADGRTSALRNKSADWQLQAPRAVTGATITITDSTGSVVFTEKRNLVAGSQSYNWNGRTSTGAAAADGEYSVNVTALDSSGQTVAVTAELQGVVEKVDVSGTEPTISIGKIIVPLSKVKTIQKS